MVYFISFGPPALPSVTCSAIHAAAGPAALPAPPFPASALGRSLSLWTQNPIAAAASLPCAIPAAALAALATPVLSASLPSASSTFTSTTTPTTRLPVPSSPLAADYATRPNP